MSVHKLFFAGAAEGMAKLSYDMPWTSVRRPGATEYAYDKLLDPESLARYEGGRQRLQLDQGLRELLPQWRDQDLARNQARQQGLLAGTRPEGPPAQVSLPGGGGTYRLHSAPRGTMTSAGATEADLVQARQHGQNLQGFYDKRIADVGSKWNPEEMARAQNNLLDAAGRTSDRTQRPYESWLSDKAHILGHRGAMPAPLAGVTDAGSKALDWAGDKAQSAWNWLKDKVTGTPEAPAVPPAAAAPAPTEGPPAPVAPTTKPRKDPFGPQASYVPQTLPGMAPAVPMPGAMPGGSVEVLGSERPQMPASMLKVAAELRRRARF